MCIIEYFNGENDDSKFYFIKKFKDLNSNTNIYILLGGLRRRMGYIQKLRALCTNLIALIVFGVNPLFLRDLH